ncbi:hypothetical protein ACHAWF_004972 [Thalassiosira exigua]
MAYLRASPLEHCRPSNSSLSSYDSGSGGGKLKPSFRGVPKCGSDPWSLKRRPCQRTTRRNSTDSLHPLIKYKRAHGSSIQNDEWVDSGFRGKPTFQVSSTNSPSIKTSSSCPKTCIKSSSSLKACMKSEGRKRNKTKRRVAFGKTSKLSHFDSSPADPSNWYDAADLERFRNYTVARAAIIRRSMEWASVGGEKTYNPALGLTSPRVLKEYLATPEEVVGIECLLRGQDAARSSLARFHKRTLLDGERGRDDAPESIAEELRNRSVIATRAARRRAEFVLDLN